MILGQMIPYLSTGNLKSPPFGRGGQQATFSIDVQHKVGTTPALGVDVQHKNREETTWASAGSFTSITATGMQTKTLSALKEQIRFKYAYTAGAEGDFFWIQVLAPVWQIFDD